MKYKLFSILRGGMLAVVLAVTLGACAQSPANRDAAKDSDSTMVGLPQKVSILGDSYSTFEGWLSSPEYLAWYKPVPKEGRPTDVTKVEQTWWKIFIDENGYELEKNNSFSGSTVCNTGYGGKDYSSQSFVTRLSDLGNPNIILVFGGTNDDWAGSPMGDYVYSDWTTEQLYSYRPATAYMLSELQQRHPQALIVVMINDILRPEVTDSTIEICRHYGVPYVQLKDIDKISDHPSLKGMRKIADQLEETLK